MPKVSICSQVLNNLEGLKKMVKSVVDQTFKDCLYIAGRSAFQMLANLHREISLLHQTIFEGQESVLGHDENGTQKHSSQDAAADLIQEGYDSRRQHGLYEGFTVHSGMHNVAKSGH